MHQHQTPNSMSFPLTIAMETQLRSTEMIYTSQTQTTQATRINANLTDPYSKVTDENKVARRRIEDRRAAIKRSQSYNIDRKTFSGSFESNWSVQFDDNLDMCANYDVPDEDKLSFSCCTPANGTDARQYYDSIIAKHRESRGHIIWE